MATYLPIWEEMVTHLTIQQTNLGGDGHPPTYSEGDGHPPTYLGGDGHPPTYLGGDGHLYPPI